MARTARMRSASRVTFRRLWCMVSSGLRRGEDSIDLLGSKAGPSKLLCKYQNCTNPSCAFRHEDADGNPIPPPALSKTPAMPTISTGPLPVYQPSSDNEDGDVEVVMTSKSLLDGPLDDSKPAVACRFGERCTRREYKGSGTGGSVTCSLSSRLQILPPPFSSCTPRTRRI
jgi:hypothetical protein